MSQQGDRRSSRSCFARGKVRLGFFSLGFLPVSRFGGEGVQQGEPYWSFVTSVSGWVLPVQQQDSVVRLLQLLGQGGSKERALPSCQLRLVMVCQAPAALGFSGEGCSSCLQ